LANIFCNASGRKPPLMNKIIAPLYYSSIFIILFLQVSSGKVFSILPAVLSLFAKFSISYSIASLALLISDSGISESTFKTPSFANYSNYSLDNGPGLSTKLRSYGHLFNSYFGCSL